jgi:hypothetical protein
MVDPPEREFEMKMPHRRCDAALLVAGGDDDTQLVKPVAIHGIRMTTRHCVPENGQTIGSRKDTRPQALDGAHHGLMEPAACS